MRIKSVSIRDIKGIRSIEFNPGTVTVVSGPNGSGKSSLLDAFRAVFDGGHDPALIRKGAKHGEVSIVLENGTVIRKTITPKSSTVEIKNADGLLVPKPQAFIEKLAVGFSYDPLRLITAAPKDRAKFLLEAMPIRFSAVDLARVAEEVKLPGEELSLDVVEAFRRQVYESRRVANVAERDLTSTIDSLRKSLPDESGFDGAAMADRRALIQQTQKERSDAIASVTRECIQTERRITAETNAKIEEALKRLKDEVADKISAVRELERNELLAIQDRYDEPVRMVEAEIATLLEQQKQAERAAGVLESILKFESQKKQQVSESMRLDRAIRALDEAKSAKLSSLPIPGVEVRDGNDLFVDGLPFASLNTQAQFVLSFQLASLKPGELDFMIADRAESLDERNMRHFRAAAEESGKQVIVAVVESSTNGLVVDNGTSRKTADDIGGLGVSEKDLPEHAAK